MFKSKITKHIYISIITLLVVLLIFIIGYALTSSKVPILTKKAKTDISVFTSVSDYTTKYTLLNEVSDEYMTDHTDISVTCSSISAENFYTRLLTDFSSGYQADIIITYPTRTMETLFNNGLLADLTAEFQNDPSWYDLFDKSALQFCASNERIFAAPMETEFIGLYVNKKLLAKNGLSVPKTYDDLKNCITVLHRSGITPFSFGLKDENLFLYQALTVAFEKNFEIEQALSDERFTPAYVSALKTLKELYDLGAFPENCSAMTRSDVQKLFTENDAAFIVESSSFAGDIENSMKLSDIADTYSVIPFPSPHGYYSVSENSEKNFSPIIYGVGDMTVFVSSEAYNNKHDAVMDYIKYLTGAKMNSKFVSRAKFLSALKNTSALSKNGPLITQCNLIILNSAEFAPVPSNITDRSVWDHTIGKGMSDILNGSISAEELISNTENLSRLCTKEAE